MWREGEGKRQHGLRITLCGRPSPGPRGGLHTNSAGILPADSRSGQFRSRLFQELGTIEAGSKVEITGPATE